MQFVESLISRSLFPLDLGGRSKTRPWERDLIWRYVVRGCPLLTVIFKGLCGDW